LVYFEEYDNDKGALIRERRMKKWKRDWKIELIEKYESKLDGFEYELEFRF